MITFVDPRSEPGTPIEDYDLHVDVTEAPVTIGLVANGFPDSARFLDHVEKALAIEVPHAMFRRFDKGDASSQLSASMLDEVVADCDAVVGAYGH